MAPTPAFSYNDNQFRCLFPAFVNATTYPECNLSMYYDTAGLFVANTNFGFLSAAGATQQCLYLLTAHLAKIGSDTAEGEDTGITVAATIDKISVTMQQFQYPNQWQFWLGSTPYGRQLLALLQVKSVGGFYVPGGAGRLGFRT